MKWTAQPSLFKVSTSIYQSMVLRLIRLRGFRYYHSGFQAQGYNSACRSGEIGGICHAPKNPKPPTLATPPTPPDPFSEDTSLRRHFEQFADTYPCRKARASATTPPPLTPIKKTAQIPAPSYFRNYRSEEIQNLLTPPLPAVWGRWIVPLYGA